ncbi:MAG TPA: hypothetical protein VGM37_19090 [Armatimonadota bacterium]|jgi:hypothetical protein
MTARARALGWAGALLAAGALAGALVWVTGQARTVSAIVKRGISAPGPPVAAADLPRLLNGAPAAPFMTFDPAASNDPRTRLQAGFNFHRGGGQWILVFQSRESFDRTARWYDAHLPGWTRASRDAVWKDHNSRDEERWRSGIRFAAWERGPRRLALAAMPDLPGRVILFVPASDAGR